MIVLEDKMKINRDETDLIIRALDLFVDREAGVSPDSEIKRAEALIKKIRSTERKVPADGETVVVPRKKKMINVEETTIKDTILADARVETRGQLIEGKKDGQFYMCKFCNKRFYGDNSKEKADKHMKKCAKQAEKN